MNIIDQINVDSLILTLIVNTGLVILGMHPDDDIRSIASIHEVIDANLSENLAEHEARPEELPDKYPDRYKVQVAHRGEARHGPRSRLKALDRQVNRDGIEYDLHDRDRVDKKLLSHYQPPRTAPFFAKALSPSNVDVD